MKVGSVQVAGIIDQAEADMLVDCGVDCLGFPFRLGYHTEDLSEQEAASIIRRLPMTVTPLLITYLNRADDIIELSNELGVSSVQLHGGITVKELIRLRSAWPTVHLLKSLIITDDNQEQLEREIKTSSPWVDGYITDTFDPATGATGATGKTHDWRISRWLVEASPHPVILAGGLNPDNVRAGIRAVRPAGVDVHTGIEGPSGRKDRALTRRFMNEAAAGFQEIGASATAPTR